MLLFTYLMEALTYLIVINLLLLGAVAYIDAYMFDNALSRSPKCLKFVINWAVSVILSLPVWCVACCVYLMAGYASK